MSLGREKIGPTKDQEKIVVWPRETIIIILVKLQNQKIVQCIYINAQKQDLETLINFRDSVRETLHENMYHNDGLIS